MPSDARTPDQEIDSILRMARESGTFFSGLMTALCPQDGQAPGDSAQAPGAAEQS